MRALGMSPRDYRDMGTVVDLGPCYPCNYISWEAITQGLSIKCRLVLNYIYIPFAVREPFVGRGLLKKIALEIKGFRFVKPRDKDRSICLKSFLLSFTDFGGRTGWHHWIPLNAMDISQVARHEDLKQFI